MMPTIPATQKPPTPPPPPALLSAIPDWVRGGESDCALSLGKNLSIYCKNDIVVLRLHGKTMGEMVEFEVDPQVLKSSLNDQQIHCQEEAKELNKTELLETNLFRTLAADKHFKIRTIAASAKFALIEGTLAENATISGSFDNCILSLEGGPANFKKLNVTGASTLDLDCPNSTFCEVTTSKETAFRGNLTRLNIEGPGTRIESYCVGLILKNVTTSPGQSLSSIFKGALLSGASVDLSMFSNATKELTAAELKSSHQDLNAAYAAQHRLSNCTIRRHDAKSEAQACDKPTLLSKVGASADSTFIIPNKIFRVEFRLPASAPTTGAPELTKPATLAVELPLAKDQSPSVALHLSAKISEKEAVSGDVSFLDSDAYLPISHYAVLYGWYMARGRGFSAQQLQNMAALGSAQIVRVAEERALSSKAA